MTDGRHARSRSRWWVGVPLAVAVAALAAAPARSQETAKSLIPNGGFERDADGDGMGDDWRFAADAGVVASWSLDEGFEGRFAQRVECRQFERLSPSSHVMLAQYDTIALERGQWYRLSLAARQERLREGVVQVAIRDTGDWSDCGLMESFRPTVEWKEFAFDFQAAKTISENVRLQIWYTSTGTLWLDDVRLVRSEPVKRRFTEVVTDVGGRNLVPNSSFECGTCGWGSIADVPGWGGNLNTLVGAIDESTAQFHSRSLKIELTPETVPTFYFDYFPMYRAPVTAPLLANRGWFEVEPGAPYTLSAYMRADREGLAGRFAVHQAFRGQRRQELQFSARWTRYAYTFRPQAEQVFVAMGLDLEASGTSAGTLWVDGVQFERGEEATAYEPRAPLEVGLQWDRPGRLFPDPGSVELQFTAFNASDAPHGVEPESTITDYFDETVATLKPALRLRPRSSSSIRIRPGLPGNGFYRVHLAAAPGAVVHNLPPRFAVIEPYTEADSLWGMNHAYPWPHLLDLSKSFGLLWFRDWSLKWHDVEPEKGRFDFTEPDHQIDRVLERGINVLGLLPFPSSNWASTAPPLAEDAPGYPASRERAAYMPRDLDQFAEYVRRTVEHYRGRIQVWEILNEPIYTSYALPRAKGYEVADYIRLLAVAYKAVKAADPDAFVIGGIAGGAGNLTDEFVGGGGLQWVDALNLHTYPRMRPPAPYEDDMRKLSAAIAASGTPRPIWFTEGAYYADDDTPFLPYKSWLTRLETERAAAEYQVKFNTILMAYGVRKFIYHSGTPGTLNNESLSGIFFEWDGAPRKMVATQAAMAGLFGTDVASLGRRQAPEEVHAYAFVSGGKTIIVCWLAEGFPPRALRAPASVRLLDVVGNPLRDRDRRLTTTPVYVVRDGALQAPEVDALLRRVLTGS
jgi:hypothetical protein